MPISKSTEFGMIDISLDAISTLAGGIISECYGIIGMASQKLLKDGFADLLKRENYSKGVVVRTEDGELVLDLYVIALQGIKLTQVIPAAQQRVKYELQKALEIKIKAVNVTVQGVRTLK